MFWHGDIQVKNPGLYIMDKGSLVSPRGLDTREVLGLRYQGLDVLSPRRPNFNRMLAYVEGLQLIAGYTDLEALSVVAPKTTDKFYRTNMMSWYGADVNLYIKQCIERLKADPMTRKAVAYIGYSRTVPEDATCTLSVQFVWRFERLITVVNMRSWDVNLGMPYDITMFAMLGQAIRAILGIAGGDIVVNAASAHIYLDSYKPHNLGYQSCAWIPESFDNLEEAQKWAYKQLAEIRLGDKPCLKS